LPRPGLSVLARTRTLGYPGVGASDLRAVARPLSERLGRVWLPRPHARSRGAAEHGSDDHGAGAALLPSASLSWRVVGCCRRGRGHRLVQGLLVRRGSLDTVRRCLSFSDTGAVTARVRAPGAAASLRVGGRTGGSVNGPARRGDGAGPGRRPLRVL